MVIKILGGGCAKCKKLAENTKQAIEEMNIDATIEKIENYDKIMEYGVMSTPALVVDEKVKFSGKVPSAKEIKKYL